MILDIKTLMLLYLITNMISAGAVAIILSQNRGRFAGISFWLVDMILQAAGSLLLILRGRVPDLISMTVANTMILTGALFILMGLEHFTGKRGRQIHNYILLAVFMAVSAYFALVQPNLVVRTIALSAMTLIFTFQCCWLLLRRVASGIRQITHLSGMVFAVYAAFSLVRIILHLIIPLQSNDFFKSGAVDAIAIIGYIVLNICLTISLVLMVNRRLLAEVKDQEEKLTWLASFPTLNPTPVLEIDQKKGLIFTNASAKKLFPDLEDKQMDHPFVAGVLKYFTELNSLTMTHQDREIEVDGHWYLQTFFLVSLNHLRIYASDITDRKQSEAYREIGREILQILNQPGNLRDSIQLILTALKMQTGFEAVGIRLQDGDDFPYFAQEGFSQDFLLTENTLIERTADGGVCRDKDGNINLECTCGQVISGKTNLSNPYFTPGGSCWSNDKADTPFQDTRLHPRDRCLHDGFASVALVPIRNQDRIIGLIQLNDRRKGRLTLEIVELLEGIASHIGSALLRKQMEKKLEEMATHDFLTGLPNRVLLLDRFTIAAALAHRNKSRLAVMSLDLDKFKSINDTLGHDAGDQVLKVISTRLTGIIRASDTLARVGGDEFMLVMLETSHVVDGAAIAQKILDSFTEPLSIDGHQLHLSTSIGIAIYPEDAEGLEALTKKSDAAMYYSKGHGRNQFKFYGDGDVRISGDHKSAT